MDMGRKGSVNGQSLECAMAERLRFPSVKRNFWDRSVASTSGCGRGGEGADRWVVSSLRHRVTMHTHGLVDPPQPPVSPIQSFNWACQGQSVPALYHLAVRGTTAPSHASCNVANTRHKMEQREGKFAL